MLHLTYRSKQSQSNISLSVKFFKVVCDIVVYKDAILPAFPCTVLLVLQKFKDSKVNKVFWNDMHPWKK